MKSLFISSWKSGDGVTIPGRIKIISEWELH